LKSYFPSFDQYKKDLTALSQVMHVKKFRCLGGEPTMNKNLLDFIVAANDSGISDEVGICTNGTLYDRISDDIFKNIDILDVDVYKDSGVDYFECNQYLTDKSQTFGFKLRVMEKHSFLKMHLDDKLQDETKVQQIFNTCKIATSWGCHIFRDGYYYKCTKPVYQSLYFERRNFHCDEEFIISDGLELHEPDLESRMSAYLKDKTPLKSCSYCLGTSGVKEPHHQLSKEDVKPV
jgi:hypothetical protein